MGRTRKHNRHLPTRVYVRRGAYYYVTESGKWIRLGTTEPEMFRQLANLREGIDHTLNAVFTRYEQDVLPGKAPATRKLQTGQLAHLRRAFGHMHPDAVRPVDVARYHDLMGRRSIVQANRELSLFSHIYRMAIRWGRAETNPCKISRHPEKPRDRYVEDWEVRAMATAAADKYPYMPILMELAILTGQRKKDLIHLTRHQITEDGIEFRQQKTGKRLLVEWTPALRGVIDDAIAQHGAIARLRIMVNSRGQPLSEEGFNTAWGKVQRQLIADGALTERFRFHDLRAKAGSDGEDWRLLGHADKRTFDRIYMRRPERVKPTK